MTPLGRLVRVASTPATDAGQVVAAEMIEGGTGRLIPDSSVDVEAVGAAYESGDVLFGKLRPYLAKVYLAETSGSAIGDLLVLRPQAETHPRFVAYTLLSTRFIGLVSAATYGAKMPRASWDFIRTIPVWAPDISSQRAIADFLDRETAKIDALIEKQSALIDRLRERRRHVIDKALQPSVDQPRVPLKRLLQRLDQGISPDTASGTDEAEFWVLKSGAPNNGVFSELESKPVPAAIHIPPGIELAAGDLVVSRASGSPALVGSAAQVGAISRRLILSDKTFRLVPKPATDIRFLYWTLNSSSYRAQVLLAISGADGLANNLPVSSLKRFAVWAPPLPQQRAVAEYLDREAVRIDSLIAKAQRFVVLARERRSALITAAVTGQIDVGREAAA